MLFSAVFLDLENMGEFTEHDRDVRQKEAPALLAILIEKGAVPGAADEASEKTTISSRLTKRLEITCQIIRKKIKASDLPELEEIVKPYLRNINDTYVSLLLLWVTGGLLE